MGLMGLGMISLWPGLVFFDMDLDALALAFPRVCCVC